MTLSEENYLKCLFHLEKKFEEGVSTNAIAKAMETKASSATEMIKRLSEKRLAQYKPYQGAILTQKGKKHALKVIRKHRLWEFFLVDKLNFSWDEVHDIAEELEHIQSEKLTDHLDQFLGYPKTDPHGDPIPDRDGNLKQVEKKTLASCPVGKRGVFVGVKDSSAQFLRYLDRKKISLGNEIEICQHEEFDGSLEIKIKDGQFGISAKTAENIYIQLLED